MCLDTMDDCIDIVEFNRSGAACFRGYKVMLRNVETGELKSPYYDKTAIKGGPFCDKWLIDHFLYVVGESKKKDPHTFGMFVFPTTKDCQSWAKVHTWWVHERDMWPPVIVEVVVKESDIECTGADTHKGIQTAVVNELYVLRIVEHLRRSWHEHRNI